LLTFKSSKYLKLTCIPPCALGIIEVIWHPPIFDWIKCNTGGTSLGNPCLSACGGSFRNNRGDFLGSFVVNIGIENVLKVEF
jgi:hypothetical protein